MRKLLLIILSLPLFASAAVPTITTTAAATITKFTAVLGGNVTADGGATVTERGVCWSISINPTIDKLSNRLANGSGTGTFSATIAPLLPGTQYHVRAYAINSAGVAYGADVTFTTSAPTANRGWYFSSSTGNDNTGNGTISAPYQTLIKLQDLITVNNVTFQPGDSILFKKGDVFANGHNGTSGFQYVSCSWINDPRYGYTSPSGTAAKPIIITSYGTGAKPNFYFPTASFPIRGNSEIQHNIFEFAGVEYINIDGLNFIDTRWPATNHSDPAYTRSCFIFGEWPTGYNADSNVRRYATNHCEVKNCRFQNVSFAFGSVGGSYNKLTYDTMINMMACTDTFGTHDIGAGAFDGMNGNYNDFSHNYIESSWGKSGRNSSGQGMLGVAFDIFDLKHSRIAYNTIIDVRHAMEIGNLDLGDSTSGAQYDTFAFNKCVGMYQFGYLHGGAGDPFTGNVHNISIWNNVLIENNSSRMSGPNFGYDRKGDGTTFNQFWFFGNGNLTNGYNAGYGNFTAGSNIVTGMTETGGMVAGNQSTGSQVAGYDNNPYLPESPMAWITVQTGTPTNATLTLSQNATATASQQEIIFFPPWNLKGITWSMPPNVSSSGYYNSWDNSNAGNRLTVQYSSDNTIWGRGYDTLIDLRNNIFYNTTGMQMIPSGFNRFKHSNNIYYVKGGFSYIGASGVITNLTRMGGALGTNEFSTTTKLFVDTTATLPENWNLTPMTGSLAVGTGIPIPVFTTDFAGNPLTNPPSMGIYNASASGVIAPSVTTLATTSISYTTALIGGNITSDGGAPILRSGLMYSTIPLGTDTLTGVKVINPVLGTGVYTSPITGLTSSTTYYVRAFAINSIGITWGANVSFITLTPPTLATVITSPATSITISAATLGGNVTLDGGASVTRRGVVYSTSVISDTNSITGGGRLASGTGTGIYTIPVTGLAINTLYHVRAFVVNSVGVYLAPEVTFTTLNIPTLTTLAATSITSSSAISGGNITSDGGSLVIRRGLVYNTIPISDTGTNPKVIDVSGGTGSYASLLSSLTPNTTYYILAFAVNANGVAYGNVLTFNTIVASIPTVTWAGVTLGVTTSVVNGNVTSEGSAPVTRRGFIYSTTTPLPADTNSGIKVIATGGGLGAFQSTLTGLTALTIYYIRPFAVNSVGVSFGAETSFQTQGASSVTTTSPTAITATSATTGGVITDYGGTFVVERKLIYSTSPIVDTNSTVGGGTLRYVPNTTAYPILLTSLLPNTTYYIAAFVVNALNFLTIGNQISFTTLQLLSIPTVTTNAVTSITQTSANVGGNVTSDGNSAVTRRGILYSTALIGDTTTGTKIISGTVGTGSYTIALSSLTPNTTYFSKAFAVNAIGVSYGDNVQFVTSAALSSPTVSTNVATAIGITTATSGGNVINDGNTTVFRRGLIYSTSPITDTNSVIGGGRIISGTTGTGTYTSSLTGLTSNTLYYIVAFAVNSVGVSIGNQRTFTTLPAPTAPLVTTLPATFITISTAVIGGNVTSDGNSTVTRRGLIYSTVSPISDTNSIVGGKLIILGSGLGTFNSSLSSLTSNTTYYVKAFALNSIGITYGNEVNFATPVFTPRFSSFRVRKKYIQKP
jgi:hypothetical protein